MSTQEKLVMELVDEICDYDEYCGNENCNKCGGAIKHWKKKLTHLIDSAKREGELEANIIWLSALTTPQAKEELIKAKFELAQLKQSEESE